MPLTLTKAQILGCDDLPRYSVEVPEWGGTVTFRHFTAREQANLENLEKAGEAAKPGEHLLAIMRSVAQMLVRCLCDEQGKLLFVPDDAEALLDKNTTCLMTVFNEIKRVVLDGKEEDKEVEQDKVKVEEVKEKVE
jgi:hypothetical protein